MGNDRDKVYPSESHLQEPISPSRSTCLWVSFNHNAPTSWIYQWLIYSLGRRLCASCSLPDVTGSDPDHHNVVASKCHIAIAWVCGCPILVTGWEEWANTCRFKEVCGGYWKHYLTFSLYFLGFCYKKVFFFNWSPHSPLISYIKKMGKAHQCVLLFQICTLKVFETFM